MNAEPPSQDFSKAPPTGQPNLTAAITSLVLPIVVGSLSLAAQAMWHDHYWGILGQGKYTTRTPAVAFGTVAWLLWFFSAAVFLIVAFYTIRLATRRGSGWVIGISAAVLAGGVLLGLAAWGAAMGGA